MSEKPNADKEHPASEIEGTKAIKPALDKSLRPSQDKSIQPTETKG